jgi:hypothetical protein
MAELTINPQEITAALRKNLDGWEPSLEASTVGYVTAIGDGVARVAGLESAMASELLEFPGGLLGVALNLDEDSIGAVIMGDAAHIQEGDRRATRSVRPVASSPSPSAMPCSGVSSTRSATPSTARGRSTRTRAASSRHRLPPSSSASRFTSRSRRVSRPSMP